MVRTQTSSLGLFGLVVAGLLLSAAAGAQEVLPVPSSSSNAAVEVFFSPGSNVEHTLASEILKAKKRVWLAGYTFTSAPIAKALRSAHDAHLDVRIVLDSSQATAKYSSATYFHNSGVPVRINNRYPIMHHKFLVIDDDIVGFGSMNFTKAGAIHNAENFNLFRKWKALADTYARQYLRLEREGVEYLPGAVTRFQERFQEAESR